MEKSLSLAEELLLLALHEEKGTVLMAASMALPYGLAGALLHELALAGLVRVEGKHLLAEPRGSTRDELLDEVLAAIRGSERPRTLNHWIGRFGRSGGKTKKRLLARLVDKRILGREERRLFWIFPATRYPQADPRPEMRIRREVRDGVLGYRAPGERAAALIGLVYACGLVGTAFAKDERREARKRAKAVCEAQPIGKAVARAVEMVQAGVIAAASS